MKLTTTAVVLLTLLSASPSLAAGGVHVATVTDIEGTVTLFTHPSKNEDGPPPHALYNGIVYSVSPVKQGDTVENGNILRTAPDAKARVIFPNGDQFYVGPQTAYLIAWQDKDPTGNVNVNLAYGGIRGVVQKGGPLKHLTVRTRGAVMGVRGTDFFIGEEPTTGATTVSVLRGQVELKSEAPKAKPVPVDAGFSAKVTAPPTPVRTVQAAQAGNPPPPVSAPIVAPVVRKTSKEELRDIQSDVSFHPPAQTAAASPPAPEIQELQKKAFQTTLQDIKVSDPKTYAQLEAPGGKAPTSIDELNRHVVEKEAALAPSIPESARKKPTVEEERRREEQLRRKLEERDFNGAQ